MTFSPLEQFEIIPLIPLRVGAFDISFTNATFMMVLSAALVIILVQLISVDGNGSLVPNRWQIIVEEIYLLLVGMVYENLGRKGGEFFALIFTLFTFILVANLSGLVPYSYTVTSHLIVTMTLSMMVWVGKLIVGLRGHGLKLFGMFIPAGLPFAMVPFFVFVECIGFCNSFDFTSCSTIRKHDGWTHSIESIVWFLLGNDDERRSSFRSSFCTFGCTFPTNGTRNSCCFDSSICFCTTYCNLDF